MSRTVSRRLTVLGAAAAGAVLFSVAGCSPDAAGKSVSEVSPSVSAEAETESQAATALPEQRTVTTDAGVAVTIAGESVVLGDPTAATRVLVYQDLACPHCKSLHDVIGDDVLTWAAGDSVAVEIVTVDYLGRGPADFSTEAANLLATVAAHDPASWLEVQEAIFAAQADAPSGAALAQIAVDAGADLDDAALGDFDAQAYDAFVDAATAAAMAAGIDGIPQVFVDRAPVRGADYAAWGEAIRAAVEASVTGG